MMKEHWKRPDPGTDPESRRNNRGGLTGTGLVREQKRRLSCHEKRRINGT